MTGMTSKCIRCAVLLALLPNAFAGEQILSKADRILQEHGYQIVATVDPGGDFDLAVFRQAHYTTLCWQWNARVAKQGPQPGVPWSRWVSSPDQMPPLAGEAPYMSRLVSLQLSDEPLHDWDTSPKDLHSMIRWTRDAAADRRYEKTILFTDLNGIDDATTCSYIRQGNPDMIVFDTYPWQSHYRADPQTGRGAAGAAIAGPPTGWYSDMRRYRADSLNNGILFGAYRQLFHAVQDYDRRVYRDPSTSELALNTFAAQAFGAKMILDFIYNDGASSLFHDGVNADPTPLFDALARVNQTALYYGQTLVYLEPIYAGNERTPTTDVMFLRGKHRDKTAPGYNTLPWGFQPNKSDSQAAFTTWTFGVNDPWLSGFKQGNIANTVNPDPDADVGLPGDVIIAWFKPIGLPLAQAVQQGDIYFMVVNGLTAPAAGEGDCLQHIHLDFSRVPLDKNGEQAKSIQYINPRTGRITTITATDGLVKYNTPRPAGTVVVNNTSQNAGDPVTPKTKLRVSMYLDGGQALIFRFKTATPFIMSRQGRTEKE